jgi:acetyl-CoA carboxylase biotin carboxyl carrier protein
MSEQQDGDQVKNQVVTGENMAADKKNVDVFDVKRLRDLIDLMKEHELHEVDLKQDKQHIRLARGGQIVQASPAVAPVAAAPAAAPAAASAPATGGSADSASIVTIDSPMVGTFYSKANPESAPFVKVGDSVGAETVVCIIEAMKVFNEIMAEVKGEIVAVLVDNEEAVEFGKPLFKVDTSK